MPKLTISEPAKVIDGTIEAPAEQSVSEHAIVVPKISDT
jgi:hypothetical protein